MSGTYSGVVNDESVAGHSVGKLSTDGSELNTVTASFSSMPTSFPPLALGFSVITFVCKTGSKSVCDARNLWDLASGEYSVRRTFYWPTEPGSTISATGHATTSGGELRYEMDLQGTYRGPTDLVGARDYTVRWTPTTVDGRPALHEEASALIRRQSGDTFPVRLITIYEGLHAPLEAPQVGEVTARSLDADGAHFHIEWTGELRKEDYVPPCTE